MNIKNIYNSLKNHLFILLIFIICCIFYNQQSNEKYIIFPILIIFIQFVLIRSLKQKKLKNKDN